MSLQRNRTRIASPPREQPAGEYGSEDLDRITAHVQAAGFYRWFKAGYTEVRCTPLHLCLSGRHSLELAISERFPKIEIERGWFWRRLTIHAAPNRSIRIGGLSLQAAEAVDFALETARRDLTTARQRADQVGARLIALAEETVRLFEGTHYIRHSAARPLPPRIERALRACRSALVRRQFDDRALAALGVLEKVGTSELLESAREAANDRFVASQASRVQRAVRDIAKHELTDEQADAVATDEDVTLVVAGAGAGKTAVITAKVAHLVRNLGADQGEILVLAFNRKAAAEVEDRLSAGFDQVDVRTFHGFGFRVIEECEGIGGFGISPFALHDKLLPAAITRWLEGLPELLLSFLLPGSTEYRSAFDFNTSGGYGDYVRTSERRTLSGEVVKGPEHVQIANILTANGIRFEYESRYRGATRRVAHQRYKPDFHLPDHDLYIEHFALDEHGRAPRHFRNYEALVRWKRSVHQQCGTRLIEVHSWQCRDGVLFDHLRYALEREGVILKPVSPEDLLGQDDKAAAPKFSSLAMLVATFLQHVRGAGLSAHELEERASRSRRPLRSKAFLRIFEQIRRRYEAALAGNLEVDFNDLIIRAAELIDAGQWRSPYRYVLVDEFQDISAGRMRLLEALKVRDTAFFLVGDDWQSIYRFAGSDVHLFRNCEEHLGHVKQCDLTRTFRYGEGILKPTAHFVQQNPTQTRRALRSASKAPDEGITVVACSDQRNGIEKALRDIVRRERRRRGRPSGAAVLRHEDGEEWLADVRGGFDTRRADPRTDHQVNESKPFRVLALGRYRSSKSDLPSSPSRGLELDFSTVHAAKGREADYSIVLDLNTTIRGFPSRRAEDPILELVLPKPSGAVEFGEERRLFYVAATRAKRGTYLITDATLPSPFIEELLASFPSLRQLGALDRASAPPCPGCDGFLVISATEKNLRCTNHPFCRYLAPRCSTCSRGYLVAESGTAACTEAQCALCPRCGTGVLVKKSGRYGPFLGCSAFSSVPPCGFTENLRYG